MATIVRKFFWLVDMLELVADKPTNATPGGLPFTPRCAHPLEGSTLADAHLARATPFVHTFGT